MENFVQKPVYKDSLKQFGHKLAIGSVVFMGLVLVAGIFLPANALEGSLPNLEASYKAQMESIQEMRTSLCQTEIAIAKEKMLLHIKGLQKLSGEDYSRVEPKSRGENLTCNSVFQ